MRPDEGGCADLRKSHTAHTKSVRSYAYAPARRSSTRAAGPGVVGGARGVSARNGRPRYARATTATLPGAPSSTGTGPPSGDQTPYRHRTSGRTRLAVLSEESSPKTSTESARGGEPESSPRPARYGGVPRGTSRTGPGARRAAHGGAHKWHTSRVPKPLDSMTGAEFPESRGVRTHCTGADGSEHDHTSRRIGALIHDTYARAAAPSSRGARAPGGPVRTRA